MDVVSDSCILSESVIETNFQINIHMVNANIQMMLCHANIYKECFTF